jgi:hypothetical protein
MEKEDLKKHRHDSIAYNLPYFPNARSVSSINHAMLNSIEKSILSEGEKSRQQIIQIREEDKEALRNQYRSLYGNNNEVPLAEFMRQTSENNKIYQNWLQDTARENSDKMIESFTKSSNEIGEAISSIRGEGYELPAGFSIKNRDYILKLYASNGLTAERTKEITDILNQQLYSIKEPGEKDLDKCTDDILKLYSIDKYKVWQAFSNIFNEPVSTLRRHDKKVNDYKYLLWIVDILNLPGLLKSLEKMSIEINRFDNYKKLPIPNEVYAELANAGWLNAKWAHTMKQIIPQARRSGTLTDTNYFLNDLLKEQKSLKYSLSYDINRQTEYLSKQNELGEMANLFAQQNTVINKQQLEILKQNNISLFNIDDNIDNLVQINKNAYKLQLSDNQLSQVRNSILERSYEMQQQQSGLLDYNNRLFEQSLEFQQETNEQLVNIDATINNLLAATEQGFQYLNTNFQNLIELTGYGFQEISSGISNLNETTQQGFNLITSNLNYLAEVNQQGLQNLLSYMAIANAAIVNEIQNSAQLITEEIRNTNQLLNLLLQNNFTTLDDESKQRLIQGNIAFEKQKYTDAIKCYELGLERNPINWQIHFGLAAAYEADFDFEKSAEHYSNAAVYSGDEDRDIRIICKIKAARLYDAIGRTSDAIEHLKICFKRR